MKIIFCGDSYTLGEGLSSREQVYANLVANHYNIEFESIDNNEVCLINITKSKKPVFVHFDYEKEKHNGTYFRRDGRNSIPLTPEEMFKHIQSKNNL